MSQIDMTHDMRRFAELCTRLSAASGAADLQRVVMSESGSVVKVAATMQKVADVPTTTATAAYRALHSISTGMSGGAKISVNGRTGRSGGERGTIWFRARAQGRGGKDWRRIGTWRPPFAFIRDGRHLSSTHWAIAQSMWADAIQDAERDVKEALKARGLTMQSWVQIIEGMGLDPNTVAPKGRRIPMAVRRAKTRRGPIRTGFASVEHGDRGTSVVLRNANRIAIRKGGAGKLSSALATRRAAFLNAVRNGVFDTIAGTARMYPGLVVR